MERPARPTGLSGTTGKEGRKPTVRQTIAGIPRAITVVWSASPGLSLLSFSAAISAALVPVASALLVKLLVDAIGSAALGSPPTLGRIVLLLVLLGFTWFGEGGLASLSSAISSLLRFRVEERATVLLMQKCCDLDLAFFETPSYLNMVKQALSGAVNSAYSVVTLIHALITSTIGLCAFTAILLRFDWRTVLLVLASTVPHVVLSASLGRRRWRLMTERAEQSRRRAYWAQLLTDREAAKEIKSLGISDSILARYRDSWRVFYAQEVDIARRFGGLGILACIPSILGRCCGWAMIVFRALSGAIGVGDVVLYTRAVSQCQSSLLGLFQKGGQFYEQTLFLSNLFGMLDMDPGLVRGSLRRLRGPAADTRCSPAPPRRLMSGIEFRDVCFSYPGSDRYILQGLNFVLRVGESTAFVGRNGAGKTTLAKLMLRLYDPTEGQILMDGRDIREYSVREYRECIGAVRQDFSRFMLRARENIGLGHLPSLADMEAIEGAAREADVHDVILGLHQQYETHLGRTFDDSCTDLSGGEWQKLALARAYIRKPFVLIVDEPTGQLDPVAEKRAFTHFNDPIGPERITVLISHRLGGVKAANKVIVLDRGAIAESGSHAELTHANGPLPFDV